jgi:hypothetical protein
MKICKHYYYAVSHWNVRAYKLYYSTQVGQCKLAPIRPSQQFGNLSTAS